MILSVSSQTLKLSSATRDSTILPNKQLKIALKLIEQGEFCELENQNIKKENLLLYKNLSQKDTTLLLLEERISTKEEIITGYKNIQEIYELENQGLRNKISQDLKDHKTDIKNQKRKTIFYKILAGTIAGTAGYLIFK